MKIIKPILLIASSMLLLGACGGEGGSSITSSGTSNSDSGIPSIPSIISSSAEPDTKPKFTKAYAFKDKEMMTWDLYEGENRSGNEEVTLVSGTSVKVTGNVVSFVSAGDSKIHVKAAKGESDCDFTVVDSGTFTSNEFQENATLVLNQDMTFTLSYSAHTWKKSTFEASIPAFNGSGTYKNYIDESKNNTDYLQLTFNGGTVSPLNNKNNLITVACDKTSTSKTMNLYASIAIAATDNVSKQALNAVHTLNLQITK